MSQQQVSEDNNFKTIIFVSYLKTDHRRHGYRCSKIIMEKNLEVER